ncbi:MAG: S9 family peptidase [Marinilabiliaceae bacterium]|nr:S9 family peptidase [Marinilabiliaceae bacterium]
MVRILCYIALMAIVSVYIEAQTKRDVEINDLYNSALMWPEDPMNNMVDIGNGSGLYAVREGLTVALYDYAGKEQKKTLMNLKSLTEGAGLIQYISEIEPTSSETQFIVRTKKKRIYRHSYEADHYIYNTHYNTLTPLSQGGRERCVEMSPNGAYVAFVRDGNIYLKKMKYNSTSAITTDGALNKITNGAPDWVYEEEFSTNKSLCFSPDSKEIAYIKYDESKVKEFSFPTYSHNLEKEGESYPGSYTFKYPKAGEENSIVKVCVYNIETRKTKEMQIGSNTDIYIPRIFWTGAKNELCIVRLNRRQNELELLMANTQSTVTKSIYTDRDKCYVDELVLDNIYFLPESQGFLILSEQDGYMNIYHYAPNGVLKSQLTNDKKDVMNIVGYHQPSKSVIYSVASPTPMERRICTVSLDSKKRRVLFDNIGTYEAKMCNSNQMLLVKYSNTTTPPVFTLCDCDGTVIRTIEDNKEYKSTISAYRIYKKEFMKFKAADGTTQLNAWMIKPSNFSENKKYPLLIVQYSGPASQEVLNKWEVDWEQTLASKGYIVVSVDPRGTGARGAEFKKCTYQKLGKYETDDMAAVAKQLGTLSYVDAKKIGIWGWSYGGFVSSLAMCRHKEFAAGIAVAPVTSFRFYDTIYTERFMRKPDENISGYDDYAPINNARNLTGRLFLIHGTADDNVHFQNQMAFVEALLNADKEFDMFVYPNQNHSIPRYRVGLYEKMLKWLKTNL